MNLKTTKLTDLKQELYSLIDSWDNVRLLNSNTLYFIWHAIRISKTVDIYSIATIETDRDIEISNKFILWLLIEEAKKEREFQLTQISLIHIEE